jgi:hypothetical protein
MAQGNRRPTRHARQQSRVAALVNTNEKHHAKQSNVPDEATINYIKRVLCRKTPSAPQADGPDEVDHKPLEELLPPLTSSNEIDIQLYALIAVVLNLFVQTWYNKITPDQDFVANVVQIIAHCTRGLEQRLRDVDLESLLLEELPSILNEHIDGQSADIAQRCFQSLMHSSAIRIASQTTQSTNFSGSNRAIYHALRPHHALTPTPDSPDELADQQENESAWCQMVVNRALALLLPYEEHQNPCLQVLVSEILAEMIFHNGICGKACENWLLWEGVTKVIYVLRPDLVPAQPVDQQPINQLKQFGLVSKEEDVTHPKTNRHWFEALSQGFWALLQSFWLFWIMMRSAVVALMQASSLPARSTHEQHSKLDSIPDDSDNLNATSTEKQRVSAASQNVPILGMALWTCLSKLAHLQERMPWLTGSLSLMQWLLLHGPGQVCYTNSRFDR